MGWKVGGISGVEPDCRPALESEESMAWEWDESVMSEKRIDSVRMMDLKM